jgi:drug/metabolite transporter (DMT)-like permease
MNQQILLVTGMMLVAALAHAAWNVLLKDAHDPLRLATRSVAASAVMMAPLGGAYWVLAGHPALSKAAAMIAAVSAVVELAYFVFLSAGYRRGELSVVYPIARGTAPVLAVLSGIVLLGERLAALQLAGVVLMLVGLWLARRPAGAGAGVLPALAAGVTIATYTSLDRVGVRLADPLLYAWLLWTMIAVCLLAFAALRATTDAPPPSWGQSAVTGGLMTIAYVLVLVALRMAPLAAVAPLREGGIVLVSAWVVWRGRERQASVSRLAGAGAIVAGVTLLALR